MNVVVFTSDDHNWCLQPFAHLFNKYWGENQGVTIAGYTVPTFKLPDNFKFYSIASPQYGKAKWGDGVVKFFHETGIGDAVIMLEDYWLCRKVDVEGVEILREFLMYMGKDCLRVDLTADRLYAGGMRDYGYWERFDIIQAVGAQYEMSLQTGVWNTDLFCKIIIENGPAYRSAWDVELKGTEIVNKYGFKVFGTRQWPMRYANGLNNAQGKRVILSGLTKEDTELVMPFVPEENR